MRSHSPSDEVLNGQYSQFQLAEILDKTQLTQKATKFLLLTYSNSAKELPAVVAENLIQLPGGEDWIDQRQK